MCIANKSRRIWRRSWRREKDKYRTGSSPAHQVSQTTRNSIGRSVAWSRPYSESNGSRVPSEKFHPWMWIPLVSEHCCARRHFSSTQSGIGASGATNERHDGLGVCADTPLLVTAEKRRKCHGQSRSPRSGQLGRDRGVIGDCLQPHELGGTERKAVVVFINRRGLGPRKTPAVCARRAR